MFKTSLVIGLAFGVLYGQEQSPDGRLRTATTVLHEILSAPDKGIPQDLLARAQCVMVVPGLNKAAFVVGGEYGRGFAMCRQGGQWGPPAAIRFSWQQHITRLDVFLKKCQLQSYRASYDNEHSHPKNQVLPPQRNGWRFQIKPAAVFRHRLVLET